MEIIMTAMFRRKSKKLEATKAALSFDEIRAAVGEIKTTN
jgi:hypothetical protein